jgi:hypothetical protein
LSSLRQAVRACPARARLWGGGFSSDARATTIEVDCQMKNAPIASRQVAPVPRRSSAHGPDQAESHQYRHGGH